MPLDPPAAPEVSFRGVTKVYAGGQSVVALDRVALDVPAGQFVALVGESGSGKSTLLHLAGGIDRPSSGEVLVGARDIGALPESQLVLYRRREVGIVFQFFNLLAHLTIRENVELPGRLDGRADAAEKTSRLLERVGLGGRADAHPWELSGGQMQRAAIARALATGARLLLADEPTGNLDSRNGEEVLKLLDEIRRERGVTLLLATHSRSAAERAERIVHLRDGRVSD